MTYTFDQMGSDKPQGLPEQNIRNMVKAASGKNEDIPKLLKERARDRVIEKFREMYGISADTVDAAEQNGVFVCMAYRIAA